MLWQTSSLLPCMVVQQAATLWPSVRAAQAFCWVGGLQEGAAATAATRVAMEKMVENCILIDLEVCFNKKTKVVEECGSE